ncbi:undecaprenyldiphospho-muramoylpentapeptide beta-N-acetylglucosaminyltransferase [Sneathiella sp. P13V-1]|uniref:undecaprenyldiphospho-muramoylpentapeptide beta-N-acetylglucosaminyltransferase n=1 Tax=Sneathiella sp. P13V-1 TaxID=2697366 RepID=UPI00187B72D0|nr:undecaprenyldiphospho-muramoylpentapeptide beta-N-acetylglucosaminyltransferase [Sneathiella sp. P13V-1]MBE7636685.1 undecaprenyldiphospho-muramoylpentapeptide beta-N-acetylglucosaminyltransferase [Sneathiella sp. P13V-1]
MVETYGHFILASGGTGGHVFPARALAQELLKAGHKVSLVTDQRGEKYEAMFPGVHILQVHSASPSVGGLLGKVKAAIKLGHGVLQSIGLLRRLKPQAVIGFGGYPSMPPCMAAGLLGIPLILHEQNSILGRVNKLLAGKATYIATSFKETYSDTGAITQKMVFTGNPVRQEILAKTATPYDTSEPGQTFNLLVLGGSQGATVLSDTVPAALISLPEHIQKRLSVTQQCRPEDIGRVEAAYRESEIKVELSSFFENVPELISDAHLVIARSGASTMAEVDVIGRPAIYVPYKFAMDNHQLKNAESSVSAGAAKVIEQDDFKPEKLKEILLELMDNSQLLQDMAMKAFGQADPHAAEKLAELVIASCNLQNTEMKTPGKVEE